MAIAALEPGRCLRELLLTIPQEIYDKIYDEVFTAYPSNVVIRGDDYKWPHLLHIDRSSREKYAKSYFGSTAFFCVGRKSNRWIYTFCVHHMELIEDLFYIVRDIEEDYEPVYRERIKMMTRSSWVGDYAKEAQVIETSEAKNRFGIDAERG